MANWWRGKRLPPAWLALALSALDAGDVVNEPLTPEALRDRMAEQRWGPAGLAAALGVARAAITRWQAGRSSPAAGVTLALAEAGPPGRGGVGRSGSSSLMRSWYGPPGGTGSPTNCAMLSRCGISVAHTVTP